MKYILPLLVVVISTKAEAAVPKHQVVAAIIVLEAGGEGIAGMQAVACVIQNRMGVKGSAYSVATKPLQFSAYNGYRNEEAVLVAKAQKHPRYTYALLLAMRLNNRERIADITNGSDHYHNTTVKPSWAAKMVFKKKIGNHIFYKSA